MRGFSYASHVALTARKDAGVMSLHPRTRRLHDPVLPELAELVGDSRPQPLRALVTSHGGELLEATPTEVTWWPGESVTIRYEATIDVGNNRVEDRDLVAKAGRIPDGAILIESNDMAVGVWELPYDPVLPGLSAALDPDTSASLLSSLGAPPSATTTRLHAYRPGKRAVVSIDGDAHGLFLKVVKPSKSEHLHQTHREIAGLVRVPHSLGYDPKLGVVALESIPGSPLSHSLHNPNHRLPDVEDIVGLPDSLPQPDENRTCPSPLERLDRLSQVLTSVVPEHTPLLSSLLGRIGPEDRPPDTVVHGDFYESQILTEDGQITGLVDVDNFGWGRRGDDAANMLGHLAVLAGLSPNPTRINRYAGDLLRLWETRVDPVDLRRRIAAVILGLATGPFRVQMSNWPEETLRRIHLAERWVNSVEGMDKTSLMVASQPSHGAL